MPRSARKADTPTGRKLGEKITPKEWDWFFDEVAKNGANVSRACEITKINRTTVWNNTKNDPAFAARYEEARRLGIDVLEEAAFKRAFAGVEKPVGFYQGVSTTNVTEYSDALIQFLLKGNKPEKYRDRLETSVAVGPRPFAELSDEEIDAALAKRKTAL